MIKVTGLVGSHVHIEWYISHDVNSIGYTALMYAVDKGDDQSLQVLLEAGASIDCKVRLEGGAMHAYVISHCLYRMRTGPHPFT